MYNKERSRFFSEYGFQSFPEFESVKRYAPCEEDWNIYSEVMMSHQRGGAHANELIDANSSRTLFSIPLEEALNGARKEDVFIHAVLSTDKGKNDYANNYFLIKQKEVNYPHVMITKSIQPIEDGFEVTLNSDNFARTVFIATGDANSSFSDNYFDILPGSSVKVKIHTGLPQNVLEKQLKIVSLSDEY